MQHSGPASQRAPISVIIPTYNAGRYVCEAVDSALAQTVVPAEIIVIDDGSVDDTRHRLEPYFGRISYVYQPNKGVSAARNSGISLASQEFIAFLDADDVWHPAKLAFQLETFASEAALRMLGTGSFDWPTENLPDFAPESGRQLIEVTWERLAVRNYFRHSSVVVRREALEKVGSFDTGMQGPEDRDLWLRVAETGLVANLEAPLTGYRCVPGSVSKQAARCRAGMLRLLRKLDERQAWQGRNWLRRKAYGYVDHSCSYLFGASGDYWTALALELKSLAHYPLPYRRDEMRSSLERPKRTLVHLLRLVGLKSPDSLRHADLSGSANHFPFAPA